MTVSNNHTSLSPKYEYMQPERKNNCGGMESEFKLSVADTSTQMAMDVLITMRTLTALLNVLRLALNKIQHFKSQQT